MTTLPRVARPAPVWTRAWRRLSGRPNARVLDSLEGRVIKLQLPFLRHSEAVQASRWWSAASRPCGSDAANHTRSTRPPVGCRSSGELRFRNRSICSAQRELVRGQLTLDLNV